MTGERLRIINIDWSGPYSIDAAANEFVSGDCFGVYQVYGPHPIYGNQQLLYIGKASDRNFSTRIPEHGWIDGTRDRSQVSIYIGRICDTATPDDATWSYENDCAERLLIHAHFPPYNNQKWSICSNPELKNIHILNWKQHRDLLPEVSGLRWLRVEDVWPNYAPYDNQHDRAGKTRVDPAQDMKPEN